MSAVLDSVLTPEQRRQAIEGDAALAASIRQALPRPRPTSPGLVDAWLVSESRRQPAAWVLDQARSMARELLTLKGDLCEPQEGASIERMSLGDATVLVEYEYEAGEAAQLSGPPENCYEGTPETLTILQVFINGQWCDPADVVSDKVIERWEQTLIDKMEDDRRSAQDDAAEARAAEREYA